MISVTEKFSLASSFHQQVIGSLVDKARSEDGWKTQID